jgi:eukaryotic-like serine/threonine-protein kinase
MYLWTEFEGVTIDSAYALNKLVQTEGRSAFFSTRNANGESVLIRIIECHFDEDEIQARWRGLQTLNHPSFLCIDRFGKFYMAADDITAVYAVFERVDANLAEVLERGVLSASDAAQIGLSVSSALETLHAAGFVHEHIEPRNIYAVGDSVKLRSDCIRETPEGEAGIEARRRDVHDFAAMLIQVLLGATRATSANPNFLPSPFDEIVRNGMNGNWGLAQMRVALGRVPVPKAAAQKTKLPDPVPPAKSAAPSPKVLSPEVLRPDVLKAAAPVSQTAPALGSSHNGDSSARNFSSDPTAKNGAARGAAAKATAANSEAQSELFPPAAFNGEKHAELPGQRSSMELPVIFGISERDFRKWLSAGVVLLGVVLIIWILLHHWLGHSNEQAPSTPPATDNSHIAAMPKGESFSRRAPTAKPGSQQKEWRVVAFTYNRQDQAQKKASSLARQHPGLAPAAFSPTGKAPWLVTIGGVLQRDAAYALARKASTLGLPRDTYAQNYSAR